MIDLLDQQPDSWHIVEARAYPAAIQFYYGLQFGEAHLLPMGSQFGVVYSPNYYVHPQSPLRPWHYVVFEVSLYQYRRGRGLERSYKQIGESRHTLSVYEVAHFEGLWMDILLRGKASKQLEQV